MKDKVGGAASKKKSSVAARKNKIGSAMGLLLVVAVAIYFAAQLYGFMQADIKTETAVMDVAYDDINVFGCIIREEKPIYYTGSGVLSLTAEDGERVPLGGPIAQVYASESDYDKQIEIKKLNDKIEMLSDSGEVTGGTLAEVTELDQSITTLCKEISSDAADGNAAKIYEEALQLSGDVSRKQVVTGEMVDYDSTLFNLKKSLQELKNTSAAPSSVIWADHSGYFVSSSDGLESVFTPLTMTSLKPADIQPDKLLPIAYESGKTVVGRLVSDYKWYFVTNLSAEDAARIGEKNNISLRFPFALDVTVPAAVETMEAQSDGSFMVTLSSGYMSKEINYIRGQSAQLILKTYDGIRVDKRAVKMADGVTGIYVLNNSVMRFRPIEILAYEDNYVIVKYDINANDSIEMYDEVVVEGKDLYDGKLVMG
jgi:putative membrane fusion protein